MLIKNEKEKSWNSTDYIRTISLFLLNCIILGLIFVLTIYVNDRAGFVQYFRINAPHFVYLIGMLFLICLVLYIYFYFDHKDFILQSKNVMLVFVIIETSLILSFFIGKYIDVYARPIALGALLALMLIGRRGAIFLNVSLCLLLFILDNFTNTNYIYENYNYSSLMIGFSAGMIAIYSVSGVKSRIKVFIMGFVIAIPVMLVSVFLEYGGRNHIGQAILLGLNGGLLSVVLFMALLPFFEVAFNIITDYRLHELTDHDSKLIKRLIVEAPGTFNHSIVVSNMAEACATAIGENSQLARAAAYYHDIGKIKNPNCFGENFVGGANPHDEFTPELSTDIIRSHAKDGYDLIKRSRLPDALADVCLQHHGTMPIKFFYAKAKKLTEGNLNVEDFSYPGPKPQTKVAAIIMLADASEARLRTVANRSVENVEKCVLEIFDERMEFEQFNECDITMQEIEILRKTIVTCLTGIYHDRIKYPKLKIKKATSDE